MIDGQDLQTSDFTQSSRPKENLQAPPLRWENGKGRNLPTGIRNQVSGFGETTDEGSSVETETDAER